jgi:alpha-glucosidase
MQSGKRFLLVVALGLFGAIPVRVMAAWQPLGEVVQVSQGANALALSTASGAQVRVSFVTPDVVRVRMSPRGEFAPDFSYALQTAIPPALKLRTDDRAERIELRADGAAGARVVVQKKPALLITVYDAQGRIVSADDPARPMVFDPANGAIETSKLRTDYELYYGFGEKSLPISRHQQYMTMWNTDAGDYAPGQDPSYQTIPFFIALRDGKSYGVFFDNTWHSYFDMGKTDPRRYTFGADGGELNYYVFSGGATTPR